MVFIKTSISEHPGYAIRTPMPLRLPGGIWSPPSVFSKTHVRWVYPEAPFTLMFPLSNFTT